MRNIEGRHREVCKNKMRNAKMSIIYATNYVMSSIIIFNTAYFKSSEYTYGYWKQNVRGKRRFITFPEIFTWWNQRWWYFRSIFRTQPKIQDEAFYQNSSRYKAINYFCKMLHLRYLIGFWIRLCILIHSVILYNASLCKFQEGNLTITSTFHVSWKFKTPTIL